MSKIKATQMSTKIYDAYITEAPLHTIWTAVKALAADLRSQWRGEIGGHFHGVVPRVRLAAEATGCDLRHAIAVGQCILRGERGYNPVSSVMIYAHPDGGTVVQFFGIERGSEKLLRKAVKKIGARDYHYQNQSDRPRNVSAKEWKMREAAWDIILPDAGIPDENGFAFDLVSKKLAIEIMLTEFARKNPPAHMNGVWPKPEPGSFATPECWGFFKASDFIRSWHHGIGHSLKRFEAEVRKMRNVKRRP